MRIIQLTPGSGDNFYCENCLRDLALVRAMQRAGQDMLMVPMYLPIELEAAPIAADTPLFFGGLNVYLQQKIPLFRKTPRWVDRLFDSKGLLRKIGKLSGMTRSKDLGETTISMLQGRDGKQLKELDRLMDWLAGMDPKPEVIVVSNILLAGLAPALKERLGVPVVCLLQDEEGFLDTLPSPYKEQGWDLVRKNAEAFTAFVSVSEYYRSVMLDRLGLKPERIVTIPMGLDPQGYMPAADLPEAPTVGFLSRMCKDHGLDIVINAVHILRRDERLSRTRLRITGGKSSADTPFLKRMRARIDSLKLADAVEFIEDYSDTQRKEFLRSLSVMTVPSRVPLAYGLFAMEACACGIPFAAPKLGVFDEILAHTQSGVLYEPNDPVKLAEALRGLLLEPGAARTLGQKGREAIEGVYSIHHTVEKMTELFESFKPGA